METIPFSWRASLLGRYDLAHLHWPELLVRGRNGPRTLVRQVLTALLVLRWWCTRTPVVRTLHNSTPHESGGRAEKALLTALARLTVECIALNETDASAPSTTLISHGHYRDWYPQDVAPPVAGRLAFVGLVRPYKNVPGLLRAFAALDEARASLWVAGAVPDEVLAATVDRLAAQDSRVTVVLNHLDDGALVRAIREANAVVLPYRDMGNSGVALLALSLDRPVVVPRTASTEALAAEVGAAWVRRFDGDLTPEVLRSALRNGPVEGRPDLRGRSWAPAGQSHAELYARVVGMRAGRR